jgi:site-specific DNA-methyltransferase (adenine-specific)
LGDVENSIINEDLFDILDLLPGSFVDLMFLDPPYNVTKSFNGRIFKRQPTHGYLSWIADWLPRLVRLLKPDASVYMCGDWRSSGAIQLAAEKFFHVRSRITWEREKGRGAKANWKNCSEDVWFCTLSNRYTFNVEDVKLRRKVIAPYTDLEGRPKDWVRTTNGDYRLTYPSNLWADLSVPFWSMPENTVHPTQKPEKLLAKIILASSNPGDLVFDPFLGSGTSCVVAAKLGRRYVGVEIDQSYCCLAAKRLEMARSDRSIQGYAEGVFWERNSLYHRSKTPRSRPSRSDHTLF